MLPHPAVLDALEAAYMPCSGFSGTCATMLWAPSSGHVPRGFAGALGSPDDVRLVLVASEPGDPQPDESYPVSGSPREILEAVCGYVFQIYEYGTGQYHSNIRYILNGCFPELTLRSQLEKVWITNSILCSATTAAGPVSKAIGGECRGRYLEAQLRLFPNALVVALGSKAQQRLRGWPEVIHALSPAPPGCNSRKARPSWDAVIAAVFAGMQR